jgi:hypothetical protein
LPSFATALFSAARTAALKRRFSRARTSMRIPHGPRPKFPPRQYLNVPAPGEREEHLLGIRPGQLGLNRQPRRKRSSLCESSVGAIDPNSPFAIFCPTGRCTLRAQPVDATPSILIDNGLKPMAFLRRGLATIRGCKSTSERDQETALLAISTDLTSTCCCVS